MTGTPSFPERDARLARARRMLAAYGADPDRWPPDARALFHRFKDDYRFDAARKEAGLLDDFLGAAPSEAPSEALRMRLLDLAPERKAARFAPAQWIAARLVPAGALAAMSLAGFASGFASAGIDAGGVARAESALSSAFASNDGVWMEDIR